MVDLDAYKGDSKSFNIIITDSAGTAVNITGYTFYFTVKAAATDADADAKIKKVVTGHTAPTSGQTTIAITPTDTNIPISSSVNSYVYDIRMKDGSGNVTTLLSGAFRIRQNVTTSTT